MSQSEDLLGARNPHDMVFFEIKRQQPVAHMTSLQASVSAQFYTISRGEGTSILAVGYCGRGVMWGALTRVEDAIWCVRERHGILIDR